MIPLVGITANWGAGKPLAMEIGLVVRDAQKIAALSERASNQAIISPAATFLTASATPGLAATSAPLPNASAPQACLPADSPARSTGCNERRRSPAADQIGRASCRERV